MGRAAHSHVWPDLWLLIEHCGYLFTFRTEMACAVVIASP